MPWRSQLDTIDPGADDNFVRCGSGRRGNCSSCGRFGRFGRFWQLAACSRCRCAARFHWVRGRGPSEVVGDVTPGGCIESRFAGLESASAGPKAGPGHCQSSVALWGQGLELGALLLSLLQPMHPWIPQRRASPITAVCGPAVALGKKQARWKTTHGPPAPMPADQQTLSCSGWNAVAFRPGLGRLGSELTHR
jgi:hypothetical protein